MSHPQFTIRRLEPKPSKLFHRLALLTILISSFFAFQAAQDAFWHGVDHAQAREALTFAEELPWRKILLTGKKEIQYSPEALPRHELISILKKAGFEGEALKTAYAVTRAESSGRPKAFNGNADTGDKSYGILQINMIGNLGPARRKMYGLKSNEELFDPLTNAKIAYAMSGGGKNWKPWGAWRNNSYRKHIIDL